MKKYAAVFLALSAAGSLAAAARPEITWSIMHPTAIDIDYMRRVVDCPSYYKRDYLDRMFK